jgi:phosphate transport system substrate-binding protein
MNMNWRKLFLVGLVCFGLAISAGTLAAQRNMIQIKGSDTLVNLVQILAEEFMGKNPGTALAVLGGGSSTGIAALTNGTCHIANHSRAWKDSEIELAKKQGVTPRFFIVAVDGVSIIVNEKNPLNEMKMSDVGALYRGDIKDWRDVGGPSRAVSLYGRQSNSGTYVFMQEHVLGNKNYSTDMKEMNGNAQIIEGVIQDAGGIGYVGVGYLFDQSGNVRKGIKVLKISSGGAAFSPLDKAAVDSGDYPVSRPLFQATKGKPSAEVAAFIRYEMSDEGQKVVEREGFFPISASHKAENEKNLR